MPGGLSYNSPGGGCCRVQDRQTGAYRSLGLPHHAHRSVVLAEIEATKSPSLVKKFCDPGTLVYFRHPLHLRYFPAGSRSNPYTRSQCSQPQWNLDMTKLLG